MNEYTFQNQAGSEVKFQGDLILERSTAIVIGREFERSVKLRVYGVESGGFVPMLQYNSNSPKETKVETFEFVDLLTEVESFFLVFEANEVFKKTSGLNRGDADEQKEVSRIISNEVEKLAFELLDDLHSAAESKGFIDKPAEVKKKSMWGLLG